MTKQDEFRQALQDYASQHFEGRMYLVAEELGIDQASLSRNMNATILSERFLTRIWRRFPDLGDTAQAALLEVAEERERRRAEART